MIYNRDLNVWHHVDRTGTTWTVELSRESGSRGWWLYGEDVHGVFHQVRLSGTTARECRADAVRKVGEFNAPTY